MPWLHPEPPLLGPSTTSLQHHTPALLELDARRGPSAAERRASCADSRTRACWLAPALVEDDNAGQARLTAELVGEHLLVSAPACPDVGGAAVKLSH